MLSQQQHHKVKAKPPPLCLRHNGENNDDADDLFPSPITTTSTATTTTTTTGHAAADIQEDRLQSEFYQQFEGPLSQLLTDDDYVEFNLHTAASLGITSSVRHLIERCSVDPDSRNSGHWTAIMYASLFSHNETILYLLEMKADVNLKNPSGKTPLMLASLCGSEETIKLLLTHGALLEERDRDQFTALMLAIQATHCESAQLLLNHGADPNVREQIHGQTPLYIAAQNGQFAVARALIQKGVDVDAQTSSGDTPHHVALRNGYPAIAQMIDEARHSASTITRPIAIPNDSHRKPGYLSVAPTTFKPKSPYTAFFERFDEIGHRALPRVLVEDVDAATTEHYWHPSPGNDRCSPEGVESPAFDPFNAWPGCSGIFKPAKGGGNQPAAERHFRRSVSKPAAAAATPTTPSSPGDERYPLVGSSAGRLPYRRPDETPVKLPKDLSSVLANLGLAKYQMHFEEQDIDLQVFLTMNEDDLREIGITSLGARRKCLSTIEYFQTKSNHYQIGEQYLVNALVSKRDLADLKRLYSGMARTALDLRHSHKSPLVDELVKLLNDAELFFRKYC